jgi:hypothetical protein
MSENPYRQDNPFVSDESFQEKIKRLEADIDVLATEVRACRYIDNCEPHTCHIGYEGHWYCVACKALDDISAARETTDKSGALDRAKVMEEGR